MAEKPRRNQEETKKKKLANLKPQKSGEPSHNPYGRPKGSVNWKTLYSQLLTLPAPDQLLAEIKKVFPDAKLIQDMVVINTFNRALKGNPKAMELLHYYAGDKPKDTVEHTGNVEVDVYQKLSKDELKKELDKLGLADKLFDK